MGLLDDALARGRDLVDAALAPLVPAPAGEGLINPTLAAVTSTDPIPRDPIIKYTTAAADGTATIATDDVDIGTVWLLDYITVGAASAASSAAKLYAGVVDLAHLLDETRRGNEAPAWYAPPRRLLPGQSLVVVWTGATPGARCSLRVEYRVQAVS